MDEFSHREQPFAIDEFAAALRDARGPDQWDIKIVYSKIFNYPDYFVREIAFCFDPKLNPTHCSGELFVGHKGNLELPNVTMFSEPFPKRRLQSIGI